jgi:hypothetical protein
MYSYGTIEKGSPVSSAKKALNVIFFAVATSTGAGVAAIRLAEYGGMIDKPPAKTSDAPYDITKEWTKAESETEYQAEYQEAYREAEEPDDESQDLTSACKLGGLILCAGIAIAIDNRTVPSKKSFY